MKPEQKQKGHPHAELMKLYAEDAMESETPWKNWELKGKERGEAWFPCQGNPTWSRCLRYRRKPRFIEINGHQVPEPIKNKESLLGKGCYVPALFEPNKFLMFYFNGDSADILALERGLVHLTQGAAIAHAKALLSFTAKEVAK